MSSVAVADSSKANGQLSVLSLQAHGAQAHQTNSGRQSSGHEVTAYAAAPRRDRDKKTKLRQRWRMLAILSLDICVSYLPWYTFVPIMSQSMAVYGATAADLNMLCIVYSVVYIPGVFLTGTLLSALGCHWCFTLATSFVAAGCMLRCGPGVAMRLFDTAFWNVLSSSPPHPWPVLAPFAWLAAGQALCAVGQTFLVNATSHLAAEWFHHDERPAAAMMSNLMNFIGACGSFMQPTWYVSEEGDPEAARQQVTSLMDAQLKISLAALVVTFTLYRDPPLAQKSGCLREELPLFSEFGRVLRLRDFWLVNGQFVIYLTVLNTFDAVEGSLLATYGYSEALSSWTAVSFCLGSVLSTAVESAVIKHPAHYRQALISINSVLALSFLMGLVALKLQMPKMFFVFAVFVQGLSTPGWGCSMEMASEVCYPVREATVSSLLEAFGSIASVGGIIAAQRLIDTDQAAMVLVCMAACTLAGNLALMGLSGRLHRSEAEDHEDALSENSQEVTLGTDESPGQPLQDISSPLQLRQRGGKAPAWAEFQVV